MAFDPLALHPVARHPITGNLYWFYIQVADSIADMGTDAYFNALNTGMAVNDIIAAIGGDGTADFKVSAIDGGTFDVTTVGGTIDIGDVLVDSINNPILPDIGGTVVPTNLREALERIHQRLNLKVQQGQNVGTGTSVFVGADDADPSSRALRFRRVVAGDGVIVNVSNDTIVISAEATSGGGSGGGTDGSLIPPPPANLGFTNGSRLLYVTKDGASDPIGGETATSKFTTVQAALNAAQADDVVLVRSDVYREFPLTMSNKNSIWIVAEERGQARISALWGGADAGSVTWTDDGGGVYFTSRGSRPYIGSHGDDFLMAYLTEADLRAGSVEGVTKPERGFAFVSGEGRVYVHLRNGQDPNGQSVKLTNSISQLIWDFNNCDDIVLDGFVIEGSGNNQAIDFDTACARPTVRNCVFTHGRFGVRVNSDDTLIDTCEYRYTGFGDWCAEVFALDGPNNSGPFTLAKNYYNAAAVGQSGGSANALLEGGIDTGGFDTAPSDNITIQRCLVGPAFDGSRIGEHDNSEIKECVFFQCRDDGFQAEGSPSQQSINNQIHDSRFIDCSVGASHQDTNLVGPNYVYRNVFENRDPRFRRNTLNIIKMLQINAAQIHHYQNTYINLSNPGAANQFVWYDFSNGRGDRIQNFLNNIVIYPGVLTNGAGPNPQTIAGNAVVAPSAGVASFLTGAGGVFAGTAEGDMNLAVDLSLQASSPAVGIGTTLPGGLPDSRTGSGANDDAGAFPLNEVVGANWPRETTTTFDLNPPAEFA